jgi:hypothetical protein
MAGVLMVPLLALPVFAILAMLTGRMPIGGIWRDSFDTQSFSPTRLFQSIVAVSVALTTLIGLAGTSGNGFPPIPDWVLALAGGGNAIYLGAKWITS